ncbi:UDP-N-acetylmuramoyl-L-alanyl-D-glutamate--2,6-diaminopimelate ligase [Rubritalea spongiae]|uniref:UDP-N-acetylmuramoyl-L-alanyl-D-glutamate--2,6-diaminopimelate ligase n=1 Tax=Rubritalea spongiae TaxID=430797 RepID=A0ABW5E8F8_9BACT
MILRELLTHLPKAVASGNLDQVAKTVTADSRKVKPGSVFVAIRGDEADGHKFIESALEKGAVAIVAEKAPAADYKEKAVWIHAAETRKVLGVVAAAIAGDPSSQLKVVGVTGTNGKTTTTFLLHHIMQTVWMRAGLLGTIKVDNGLEVKEATHTTPSAEVMQSELATMLENGCRGVAMEASSHGIAQSRTDAVKFDAAVFTNLSQDHLDYHGSMEAYYEVKKSLFAGLAQQTGKKKPIAVINYDDRFGEKLVKELGDDVSVVTYGMGAHCDYKISKIRQSVRGTEFQLDNRGKSFLVRTPLIGRFNVYNTLAAIAGASAVGIKARDAVKALTEAPQVPGRMEIVGVREGATVFVDYAHTPDALENACATLRDLEPNKLITVFGCGGDRDALKRPLMGEAASEGSDLCLITSDNPRSEDPEAIIKQIEAGMKNKAYRAIVDRQEAIRTAVNVAAKGDIVLIAGKGHEAYQQFADETVDFDDRKIARWALRDKPVAAPPKETFQKKDSFKRDRYQDEKPERREGEKPEYQRPEKYGERRVGEQRGDDRRGDRRDQRSGDKRDFRGGDRRDDRRGDRRDNGGRRFEGRDRDDRK